ncbi:ThiF family adenylyltransferase [Nocardia cyriacigeorgica]|uniref:ThiF family adenylyltransferase n=1 Tax=Nocardia cyriacigeorgica TaxID=135487 RepID=UPI002458BAA5|nr:ThiF family adenylyltransferase [Nocardia cyriacigeorgica]
MTDTPSPEEYAAAFAREQDTFRSALAQLGFSDDGNSLQGPVLWADADGNAHRTQVSVVLPTAFPFAPPSVSILQADDGFTSTFHIERNGNLCLWTSDTPVHDAAWRDAEQFVAKIGGWFTQTALGWPGDEDADLERYLDYNDELMVLYDDFALQDGSFCRTTKGNSGVVTVGDKLRWTPSPIRMKNHGLRRRERDLLWVIDVGLVSQPIRNWEDLQVAADQTLDIARDLINAGSLHYILVRYQRGARHAAIVLDAARGNGRLPTLRACESADQSMGTRTLRAGSSANSYKNKSVAIVGCGAIGSQVAELLYRSGVGHLTLIDPERYRPGNVIRHTADNKYVGAYKVSAVAARLASIGLDTENINPVRVRISQPAQILDLAKDHDLIVDATADARTTALLRWSAEAEDKSVVSVCVQRNGGIARVDRFPLESGESHLDPLPAKGTAKFGYEQGCGSPVSVTPPVSVARAATTACQVALGELSLYQSQPATIIDVIKPQPDSPYNTIGTVTSV